MRFALASLCMLLLSLVVFADTPTAPWLESFIAGQTSNHPITRFPAWKGVENGVGPLVIQTIPLHSLTVQEMMVALSGTVSSENGQIWQLELGQVSFAPFIPREIVEISRLPEQNALLVYAENENAIDQFRQLVTLLDHPLQTVLLEVIEVTAPEDPFPLHTASISSGGETNRKFSITARQFTDAMQQGKIRVTQIGRAWAPNGGACLLHLDGKDWSIDNILIHPDMTVSCRLTPVNVEAAPAANANKVISPIGEPIIRRLRSKELVALGKGAVGEAGAQGWKNYYLSLAITQPENGVMVSSNDAVAITGIPSFIPLTNLQVTTLLDSNNPAALDHIHLPLLPSILSAAAKGAQQLEPDSVGMQRPEVIGLAGMNGLLVWGDDNTQAAYRAYLADIDVPQRATTYRGIFREVDLQTAKQLGLTCDAQGTWHLPEHTPEAAVQLAKLCESAATAGTLTLPLSVSPGSHGTVSTDVNSADIRTSTTGHDPSLIGYSVETVCTTQTGDILLHVLPFVDSNRYGPAGSINSTIRLPAGQSAILGAFPVRYSPEKVLLFVLTADIALNQRTAEEPFDEEPAKGASGPMASRQEAYIRRDTSDGTGQYETQNSITNTPFSVQRVLVAEGLFLRMDVKSAQALGLQRDQNGQWNLPYRDAKLKDHINATRIISMPRLIAKPGESSQMSCDGIGMRVAQISFRQDGSISLQVTPLFPGLAGQVVEMLEMRDGESAVTGVYPTGEADEVMLFVVTIKKIEEVEALF